MKLEVLTIEDASDRKVKEEQHHMHMERALPKEHSMKKEFA